eukprot:m.270158 g.270158  ORF g.270158 m.270158 type:complete len:59 (+) comp15676_c1_seq31:2599-2775(+)
MFTSNKKEYTAVTTSVLVSYIDSSSHVNIKLTQTRDSIHTVLLPSSNDAPNCTALLHG